MDSLKYIFALLVSCLIAGNSNAQTLELTSDQQEAVKARVLQIVEEFRVRLSKITNNNLTHEARKEHVNSTLRLFIGNGESYSCFDEETGKPTTHSGVKIEFSDMEGEMKRSQLLKKYIYRLYNPQTGKTMYPYHGMNIVAADAVVCDNIKKIGDHYECIAYYHVKYLQRTNEGTRFTICPSLTRKMRCYISPIELPTGEVIFPVKLGDIYTVENKLK